MRPHSLGGTVQHVILIACVTAITGCGTESVEGPPVATGASPSVPPSPSQDEDTTATATPPPGLPGGLLMFSRFDENTHTFLSTHLIRPNGTQEVEIELPGPEGGGRWSHDGSRIAVMTVLEDQRIGTAIIKPDGTVDRVLDIPDPTLSLVCTVWSPDDQRLACEGFDDSDSTRNGILTVRASDGGDLKRLTSAPEGMNDLPGDYAPDGRQIVFMRTTGEAPGLMMLIDAAGGRPRPLSDDNYGDPGRFAPDGRSILTSAGHRLVTVDLEGQVLGTIEDAGSFLFGPVWSPDGRWIAYSRSTGGFVADVWVSRPDGRDAWRVTETAANEIVVEWGSGTD